MLHITSFLLGQFGTPTFGSVGIFIGMLAATFSSIIESIGDYYATARVCEVPPPPKHAMNRGIVMEGFVSVISGVTGACHGTTSYSQMVGFIAYTGVGLQQSNGIRNHVHLSKQSTNEVA